MAIAAPDSYSSDVGMAIMERGGNAIDAAIAVQFALAVTLPEAGNIGGGGLFSVPYSPQIGNIRRQDDTTVFGLGYFYATSVRFDSITLFHPY